ncbi:TVP38/TMEM64 family protein [Methylobrevis pamukkalensis]|uniref:TVP38/TMEM64 family membrane protein n=1 Tax=Methylobrevis pamukkalensis TaxID=1439726 RepID=A0A1E3H0S4_9HYPH|nr:VTT domain-containing protein [Methylobrevis pamukkalensis]ODN69171.1 SNARE associated Golgi protein [Methylobrevis pamukkalensis]
MSASQRLRSLARLWPILVIVGALVLFLALGGHRQLSLEALVENRRHLGEIVTAHFWLALAGYALVYLVATSVSIPGLAVLTIAGGLLFGWIVAGFVVIVAATAGASVLFLVARTSLGATLREKAGPRLARFTEGFRKDAWSYLLFLRLVPIFPFWVVNLAPALAGVPFGVFLATTALGIAPGTFAFTLIGSGLDSVVEAQIAAQPGCLDDPACVPTIDPGALLTPQLVAAFVALGVIALLPVVIRAVKNRRHRSSPP